jgi:TetR/AcrR family acrAB operon transcriptional repressor
MTTATTSQSAQGRDLLIKVARQLFLERGYAQVSIQQIAEEAGMTKGAPYYHFANKQDLFIQVSLDIFADLKVLLDKGLASKGSFQQRIERATIAVVESLSGDFSQWYSDLVRLDDKQAIGKSMKEAYGASDMTEIFVAEFTRAKQEGEFSRVSPELAAHSYFLLLKATIDECGHHPMRFPGQELDIESHVRELVDIFFHGIA